GSIAIDFHLPNAEIGTDQLLYSFQPSLTRQSASRFPSLPYEQERLRQFGRRLSLDWLRLFLQSLDSNCRLLRWHIQNEKVPDESRPSQPKDREDDSDPNYEMSTRC